MVPAGLDATHLYSAVSRVVALTISSRLPPDRIRTFASTSGINSRPS